MKLKMRCLLYLAIAVLVLVVPLDGWSITWDTIFGGKEEDIAPQVRQTRDGGYFVGGTLGFGFADRRFRLIRLDQFGNISWQKTYGNEGLSTASIHPTRDGGCILAASTVAIGGGHVDVLLLKVDRLGNISWQKTYGGDDNDFAESVQQTRDGGYIVAGETDDVFLIRLDRKGNVIWEKSYGGKGFDTVHSVKQTRDGGFIVAADFSKIRDTDAWVLKVDPDGNITWQKTYGGQKFDSARSIDQTREGNYIVAGLTLSFGAGQSDLWLLKVGSTGDVLWQKAFGRREEEQANDVDATRDGGAIAAGVTRSFGGADFWLVKVDSQGNVIWQKAYDRGRSDVSTSIQQTRDGGYVAAGNTTPFGTGADNFWILKLDSIGNSSDCRSDFNETTGLVEDTKAVVKTPSITIRDTEVIIAETEIVPAETSDAATRSCGARVTQISPKASEPETILTITGSGFGSSQGTSSVLFGGLSAGVAPFWSDREIRVRVPQRANTNPLNIQVNSTVSAGQEFIVLPTPPSQIRPTSGPPKGITRVAITATSVSCDADFQILFGDQQARDVECISSETVVCTAPPGKGTVTVKITTNTSELNLGTFTYR